MSTARPRQAADPSVLVASPVLVDTPHGPARVHRHLPAGPPVGLVVLGHGAGGGVDTVDLRAVTGVALSLGWSVALVEQPYRVAGRRAPAPAHQLDAAWLAVLAALRSDAGLGDGDGDGDGPPSGRAVAAGAGDGPPSGIGTVPVVVGGRSSGARVACRTAAAGGASGVLCLAFPLHPPGRPDRSRLPELAPVTVPVLVVQGGRDPFGVPPAAPGREVVVLAGDHRLASDTPGLRAALTTWLPTLRASDSGDHERGGPPP